ncbi:zinc ribbon domain-containing protein [Staphylococcus sp.]|uniref:zinc ribbon domain-containing protein n=1 Tax=Staphylococcus sp. TaxID=29387 RepID=UPI002580CC82|nr:zinc ribbon domain-containing protein [Staphylococcus sp.]
MKQIEVPNMLLKHYKRHPDKLINCKVKHIQKIDNYVRRNKVNTVGIDLGKYRFLAASNSDLTFTFVDEHNTFFQLFRKYESRLEDKQVDNNKAYSKLKTGLKNHINQVINELIEQVNETNSFQTVFVLGDHGSSHLSFPSLIFDLIYFAIKQRKHEYDEILIVDESFTSIECPKCQKRTSQNRTKSNRFRCTHCGFYYPNDDVIAAANIAKKGKLLVF